MPTKDLINTNISNFDPKIRSKLLQQPPISPIPGESAVTVRYPGYDFTPDRRRLPEGISIEETNAFGGPEYAQGEFQSNLEQWAYFVPRVATKVASEVAKLPGYMVGLGNWAETGFNPKEIARMVDNEWIQAIDSAEQFVKDRAMPVFKNYTETHGSFMEQVFNPAFWATEGADGVGFFLSMLVPGQILKAGKVGEGIATGIGGIASKLIKPGSKLLAKGATAAEVGTQGATLASKINGGLSVVVNTLYESGAEAGESYKNIVEQLSHNYDPETGEDLGPKINPNTSQPYTEDEIKLVAGQNAANVMKTNFGILLASNLVMEQLLFHSFDNTRGLKQAIKGGIKKEGDRLSLEIAEQSLSKKALGIGTTIGTGIVSEGLWEEGAQAAAQSYYEDRAMGEVSEPDSYQELLGGLINTYVDNFSNDIDAQKSMFLGAVLGVVGGGASNYNSNKQLQRHLFPQAATTPNAVQRFLFGSKPREATEGAMGLFNSNLNDRYSDINDLADFTIKEDGTKEYKYNEDGSVKLDEFKVAEYIQDKIRNKLLVDNMVLAEERGDKESYDYLKSINDFKYMQPFLTEEGGKEALLAHLEDLAKLDHQRQIQILGQDKAESVEKIKQDLIEKANRFEPIVKRIQQHHLNAGLYSNLNYNKEDRGYVDRFLANVLASKYQTYFNQDYIPRRIAQLEAANAGLKETSTVEKEIKNKNEKIINELKKALDKNNAQWDELTNLKKLQKELNKFIELNKEATKVAEEVTTTLDNSKQKSTSPFIDQLFKESTLQDKFFDTNTSTERSILHKGTIQVKLKDAQGNFIPYKRIMPIEEIDPKTGKKHTITAEVEFDDLLYEVESIMSDGSLLVRRVIDGETTKEVGNIFGDKTIIINQDKKRVSASFVVVESGLQAKDRNNNRVVSQAYLSLINGHEEYITNTQATIDFNKAKIQKLTNKINKAFENAKAKSKKSVGRIYIGKTESGTIYIDVLEALKEVGILEENNAELLDNIELYKERVTNLKAEFEHMKGVTSDKVALIQEAVETSKESVEIAKRSYLVTRKLLTSKLAYLRRTFGYLTDFHNIFFNTVTEDFMNQVNNIRREKSDAQLQELNNNIEYLSNKELLNSSLKSLLKQHTKDIQDKIKAIKDSPVIFLKLGTEIKKLYQDILNNNSLTDEQRQDAIFDLVRDVKTAITELYSKEEADKIITTFDHDVNLTNANIEIIDAEVGELIAEYHRLRALVESSDKAHNDFKLTLNRIYSLYVKIFKDDLDQEFGVEPSQKQETFTPEPGLPGVKEKADEDTKKLESEPMHPFHGGLNDFIHSTGNFDIATANEDLDYFRWMSYVATTKDFSSKKGNPDHIIRTYTFAQASAEDTDKSIKDKLTFYSGPELGNKTIAEINKLSAENRAIAKEYYDEDIKLVVVHYSKSKKPYLVSSNGKAVTSGNTELLFSSLPLPRYVREGAVDESGKHYEVFSYSNKLKAIEDSMIKNPKYSKLSKTEIEAEALKQLEDIKAKTLEEYKAFREELKATKGSKLLKIARRTAGKKVFTEDWIEVNEAAEPFDFLNADNYEVASVKDVETTINVWDTKTPARPGFVYLKSQSAATLVKPKTLEETGEVEHVIDLLTWLIKNPETDVEAGNWKSIETFLHQLTYFLYVEDKTDDRAKYRFFTKKYKKDGKSIHKIHDIVFGLDEVTAEEFVNSEAARNKVREFLKTKYHNFDKKEIVANGDYLEYFVKDGKIDSKRYEGNSNGTKGGYREYLFKGKNTKGTVNLQPLKSEPILSAQDPQYKNSGLTFIPIGQPVVKEEVIEPDEILFTQNNTNLVEDEEEAGELSQEKELKEGTVGWFMKQGLNMKAAMAAKKQYDIDHPKQEEPKKPKQESEQIPTVISKVDAISTPDTLFGNEKIGQKTWEDLTDTEKDAYEDMALETNIEGMTGEQVFEAMPTGNSKPEPKETNPKNKVLDIEINTALERVNFLYHKKWINSDSEIRLLRIEGVKDKIKDYFHPEDINEATELVNILYQEFLLRNEKQNPFRLATKSIGTYELENYNQMRAWLKAKFPDIPVFVHDGLIEGKAWAQFKRALGFVISDIAEVGSGYHEAYHAVSLRFTTPQERESLYNEIRSRVNSKLTNDEAEEILAEEFREFMLVSIGDGKYHFGQSKPIQMTLFNRMLNWIKQFISEVFGVEFNDQIINKFNEIKNTTYRVEDVVDSSPLNDDIDIPGRFTPSKEGLIRKQLCK